jgi:hypothetical protein
MMLLRKDHRHTGMDLGDELIRLARRAGAQRYASLSRESMFSSERRSST